MIQSIKPYNWKAFFLVMIVLFSMPMRVYFPTSIIIEVLILIFFFIGTTNINNKSLYTGNDLIHVVFLFVLLVYGLVNGSLASVFFNESYRYFSFFLLLTVLKFSKVNYGGILNICKWACALASVHYMYELYFINFIDAGNFNAVPITGPAVQAMSMDEDNSYMLPQWFLGIPYFRPFGFLIQPQKSGFIPILGTIIVYLLSDGNNFYKSKAKYWYVFFSIVLLLSASKTAIASQLLILSIILFNFYPHKHISARELRLIIIAFIPLSYYIVSSLFEEGHAKESTTILNDFVAFFNYPAYNWFIGIGIPDNLDLLAHGYTTECYIARLLAQVGIPAFFLMAVLGWRIVKTHNKKYNWILIAFLFGIFSHYCVINAYFVSFVFATMICYSQQKYGGTYAK